MIQPPQKENYLEKFSTYFEWIPPVYRRKELLIFVPIISILVMIPVLSNMVSRSAELRSRASQVNGESEEAIFSENESQYLSNELLVKFKKDVKEKLKEGNGDDSGIESLTDTFKKNKVKKFEKVVKENKNSKNDEELFQWYKITLDEEGFLVTGKLDSVSKRIVEPEASPEKVKKVHLKKSDTKLQEMIDELSDNTDIEAIELNYLVQTTAVPNDPYYASTGSWGQSYTDLWGLKKIEAETAWDQTVGSENVLVAVIDTGIDRNHADIAPNMWTNAQETPGNNVDDDGNGYVDDYYGWNFYSNTNDPMDDNGHGTHCAGTIGAVGNNSSGVPGVNWNTKIMTLKFLGPTGSGYLDGGMKSIQYAADMGAKVASNSWGGSGYNKALDDAVTYGHNKGMVVIVAAGNSNADALTFSPANATHAITVAASDWNDAKASFSNWGQKIDVAAPGVKILSLKAEKNNMCTASNNNIIGGSYCVVSGTSMATPHVAGLAALLLAQKPNLTNEQIRQLLRLHSDDLGAVGKDSKFGFGRINARKVFIADENQIVTPLIHNTYNNMPLTGQKFSVVGSITGATVKDYKVELGKVENGNVSTWNTLSTGTGAKDKQMLAEFPVGGLAEDSKYNVRLSANSASSDNFPYIFETFGLVVDNFDVMIVAPPFVRPGSIVPIWGTAIVKNGETFANYVVQVSPAGVNQWSSAGVNLINNGQSMISDSSLGNVDLSVLPAATKYDIRVTANSVSGASFSSMYTVTADSDLMVGWPKEFPKKQVPGLQLASDLDSDGTSEIILTDKDAKTVEVINSDGSRRTGFPIVSGATPQSVLTGNFDTNQATKELVITREGRDANNAAYSEILIVSQSGTTLSGWPKKTTRYLEDWTSVAVADMDKDGIDEIVSLNFNSSTTTQNIFDVHILKADGSNQANFPKTFSKEVGSISRSQPVIDDLNTDAQQEIIFAIDNTLHIISSDGRILHKSALPSFEGVNPIEEITLADIDGDGKNEIFADSNKYCNFTGPNSVLCYAGQKFILWGLKPAFDASGAIQVEALSGWPKTHLTENRTDMPEGFAAGDFNNDQKDDLIGGGRNKVFMYTNTSTTQIPNISLSMKAKLTDFNGDGIPEIIGNRDNSNSLTIYGVSGSQFWEKIGMSIAETGKQGKFSKNFTSDVNGDGAPELLNEYGPSGHSYADATGTTQYTPKVSYLYVWKLPNTQRSNLVWPVEAQNGKNTNNIGRKNGTVLPSTFPSATVILSSTPTPTKAITAVPTFTPSPTRIPATPTFTVTRTPTPTQAATDSVVPLTAITSPVNGGTVVRNSTVTITGTASDNVGVTRVEFYVDNSLRCTTSASPYRCSWKVPAKKNGRYTIMIRAYDQAGNVGTSTISVNSN